MNENALKAQRKFEEVSKLVDEFGSQSEQLNASKKQLQKAAKSFENKLEESIQSIYAAKNTLDKSSKEAQQWYTQTTDEIGNVCYDFNESFGALKNVFDEENFKALCAKISELTQILEDCKALKDDLLEMTVTIVEKTNKKIEVEMASIRAQQAAERAFMEAKFAELFKMLEPQNIQGTEQ